MCVLINHIKMHFNSYVFNLNVRDEHHVCIASRVDGNFKGAIKICLSSFHVTASVKQGPTAWPVHGNSRR